VRDSLVGAICPVLPGRRRRCDQWAHAFDDRSDLTLASQICWRRNDGLGGANSVLEDLGGGHAHHGLRGEPCELAPVSKAEIVKLARPVDTIVIGNPQIRRRLGPGRLHDCAHRRGFGVTNLDIFDADGNPMVEEQVTVIRQTASSVRVYRRAEIRTLSCTPYCESSYKSEAERRSYFLRSACGDPVHRCGRFS
jgi:hypothetical protein